MECDPDRPIDDTVDGIDRHGSNDIDIHFDHDHDNGYTNDWHGSAN